MSEPNDLEVGESVEPVDETPAAPETLSLEDHESQFPAERTRTPVQPAPAPVAEAGAPETTPGRDDKGQFTGERRRAKSQRASAADVPRIHELTRKNKELEEQLAALRTSQENGNGHPPAPTPTPTPQAPPAPVSQGDPEPQEHDPKYAGNPVRFMRDLTAWGTREQLRQWQTGQMLAAQAQVAKEAEDAEHRSFAERVGQAKAQHADFDEVAFYREPGWAKDSIPDFFVRRDENGPELLYYLNSHPEETGALLKMREFGQVKFLTLLSQRLAPAGNGLTGPTTSVAAPRSIVLPPKPPNVVRTEAQRTSPGGPPDGELSILGHEQHFPPKARR